MNPVVGLNIGRVLLGLIAFVSPALAGKLFRLDVENQPQLGYMSRMFGSREIALGALTLAASGSTQRNLVMVGVAIDAGDVLAGASAGASKAVTKPAAGLLTLAALGAMAAGVVTLAGRK